MRNDFLQWLLPIVLLASLVWGCGTRYAYEQRYDLPEKGWAWEDTLTFAFDIVDTSKVYDMLLEVVHRTDYAFQNVYVRIHTTLPDGTSRTDLVSLELGDKQGRWLGDCGRKRCTLVIPVQRHVFFPQAGRYRLVIEQYMRKSPLPGIEAVGLRLRPLDLNRSSESPAAEE